MIRIIGTEAVYHFRSSPLGPTVACATNRSSVNQFMRGTGAQGLTTVSHNAPSLLPTGPSVSAPIGEPLEEHGCSHYGILVEARELKIRTREVSVGRIRTLRGFFRTAHPANSQFAADDPLRSVHACTVCPQELKIPAL